MADEQMKDHPKVYRRREVKVIEFHRGYAPHPTTLVESMTEALAKVPEEYRPACTVSGPNEDGSDWALVWTEYEDDELYQKRVDEYEANYRNRCEHVIDKYRSAARRVMHANTIADRRAAVAEMQRLEHTAKEMELELPDD